MTASTLTSEISKLRAYFNSLNGFARFFFPSDLKKALKNESTLDADVIFAAYKSTWFFHRWFFPQGLNAFFSSDAISSAQWLCNPKTNQHSRRDIEQLRTLPKPNALTSILCALNPRGEDNAKAKRNLNAISTHRTPQGVALALLLLNEQNEFNTPNGQKSFNTVITGLNTASADHIIELLKTVDLLTHANLLALLSRNESGHKLGWIEATLALLNSRGLLTNSEAQANVSAVIQHNSPHTLWKGLNQLQQANLLTKESAQAHLNELLPDRTHPSYRNPEAQARKIIARHKTPETNSNPLSLNPTIPAVQSHTETQTARLVPESNTTTQPTHIGLYQQCITSLRALIPGSVLTTFQQDQTKNTRDAITSVVVNAREIDLEATGDDENHDVTFNGEDDVPPNHKSENNSYPTLQQDYDYDQMELGYSKFNSTSSMNDKEQSNGNNWSSDASSIGSELSDSDDSDYDSDASSISSELSDSDDSDYDSDASSISSELSDSNDSDYDSDASSISSELSDSNDSDYDSDASSISSELSDSNDSDYDSDASSISSELSDSNDSDYDSDASSISSELSDSNDSDYDSDDDNLSQKSTHQPQTTISPFEITFAIIGLHVLMELIKTIKCLNTKTFHTINQPGTFFEKQTPLRLNDVQDHEPAKTDAPLNKQA